MSFTKWEIVLYRRHADHVTYGVNDQHSLGVVTEDVPRIHDDVESVHRQPTVDSDGHKINYQPMKDYSYATFIKALTNISVSFRRYNKRPLD